MLNKTGAGAGAQYPIHFSCAPARNSPYNNSKQQSNHNKSKHTATPAPKPQAPVTSKSTYTGGMNGEGRSARQSHTLPILAPRIRLKLWAFVASVAPCSLAARKAVRRTACAGPAGFERRRLRRFFDERSELLYLKLLAVYYNCTTEYGICMHYSLIALDCV